MTQSNDQSGCCHINCKNKAAYRLHCAKGHSICAQCFRKGYSHCHKCILGSKRCNECKECSKLCKDCQKRTSECQKCKQMVNLCKKCKDAQMECRNRNCRYSPEKCKKHANIHWSRTGGETLEAIKSECLPAVYVPGKKSKTTYGLQRAKSEVQLSGKQTGNHFKQTTETADVDLYVRGTKNNLYHTENRRPKKYHCKDTRVDQQFDIAYVHHLPEVQTIKPQLNANKPHYSPHQYSEIEIYKDKGFLNLFCGNDQTRNQMTNGIIKKEKLTPSVKWHNAGKFDSQRTLFQPKIGLSFHQHLDRETNNNLKGEQTPLPRCNVQIPRKISQDRLKRFSNSGPTFMEPSPHLPDLHTSIEGNKSPFQGFSSSFNGQKCDTNTVNLNRNERITHGNDNLREWLPVNGYIKQANKLTTRTGACNNTTQHYSQVLVVSEPQSYVKQKTDDLTNECSTDGSQLEVDSEITALFQQRSNTYLERPTVHSGDQNTRLRRGYTSTHGVNCQSSSSDSDNIEENHFEDSSCSETNDLEHNKAEIISEYSSSSEANDLERNQTPRSLFHHTSDDRNKEDSFIDAVYSDESSNEEFAQRPERDSCSTRLGYIYSDGKPNWNGKTFYKEELQHTSYLQEEKEQLDTENDDNVSGYQPLGDISFKNHPLPSIHMIDKRLKPQGTATKEERTGDYLEPENHPSHHGKNREDIFRKTVDKTANLEMENSKPNADVTGNGSTQSQHPETLPDHMDERSQREVCIQQHLQSLIDDVKTSIKSQNVTKTKKHDTLNSGNKATQVEDENGHDQMESRSETSSIANKLLLQKNTRTQNQEVKIAESESQQTKRQSHIATDSFKNNFENYLNSDQDDNRSAISAETTYVNSLESQGNSARHTRDVNGNSCTLNANIAGNVGKHGGREHDNGHPQGIPNVGMTCYANSVLQVLGQTPKLADKLEQSVLRKTLNKRNTVTGRLLSLIKSINNSGFDQVSTSRTSELVRDLLRRIFRGDDSFTLGEQNDAHSFLLTMFQAIENESGSDTLDLFKGQMSNVFKYSTCTDEERSDSQIFTSLLVPIPETPNRLVSLEDGLRLLQEPEQFFDGILNCRTCGENDETITTKQLVFDDLPSILVLQLGTFREVLDRNGRTILVKGDHAVKYKEKLSLKTSFGSSVHYQLYGVVCHSGNLHGGHYTSYIKSGNQNFPRWYECSDRLVHEISDCPAGKYDRQACLLFYCK